MNATMKAKRDLAITQIRNANKNLMQTGVDSDRNAAVLLGMLARVLDGEAFGIADFAADFDHFRAIDPGQAAVQAARREREINAFNA